MKLFIIKGYHGLPQVLWPREVDWVHEVKAGLQNKLWSIAWGIRAWLIPLGPPSKSESFLEEGPWRYGMKEE